MNQYDYCHNSVTLSEEQKRFANEIIWRKIAEVTDLFDRHGAQGNLYTGGSLALRQPSVELRDGKTVGLKSDLDLFLLVRNLQLTEAQKGFLADIGKLDDEVEVSVHVQPAVRLREQLYSTTIDDLGQALDRPLRQTFALPGGDARLGYDPKALALYFVNRLAMSLAPFYVTSHAAANVAGNKVVRDSSTDVKTAVVGLRFLTYGRVPDRLNLSDLPLSAREGYYEGILEQEEVLDIVRRREQYDPKAAPLDLNMADFFRRLAARDLGLDATSTTTADLTRAFVQRYLAEPNDRDGMHAFSLYLTRWLEEPTEELRALALEERKSARFPEALLTPEALEDLDRLLARPDPELAARAVSPVVHANVRSITEGIGRKVLAWYAEDRG